MTRPKSKPAASLMEKMQGEASWLLSHAQALTDYGRTEEAAVEWARAAACAEQEFTGTVVRLNEQPRTQDARRLCLGIANLADPLGKGSQETPRNLWK